MTILHYSIVEPSTAMEWDAYYELRFEVLRKPWGQSIDSTKDDQEENSMHLLMLDEMGQAAGAGRLQFNSPVQGQIRSMAVRSDLQGNGLGSKMLERLEHEALSKGYSEIILDARFNAVRFYESNGYSVTGPSYNLWGMIPHFAMRKSIVANS